MPELFDLLTKRGISVPEEMKEEVNAMAEQVDSVQGVIKTKNELLEQKRERAAADAAKQAAEAEEKQRMLEERLQLAKDKDDLAGQLAAERELANAKSEQNKLLIESVKSQAHEAERAKIASIFTSSRYGSDVLSDKLKTEINSQGQAAHVYQLDGVTYQDRDSFVAALSAIPDYATNMKGAPTSKSPATGGSYTPPAGKKPSEMTSAERLELKQKDPVKFRELFLS